MADSPAGTSGDVNPSTQDIRLAVVLNGGVSLAVWIGGVTLELHNLVQAGRLGSDQRKVHPYAQLLDVLDARLRIDVIAGTSAGGLNGAFLALGLVHGCDLSTMRDLWASKGDLGALLRDPLQKDAPSLLRGEYFYEELRKAFAAVVKSPTRGLKAQDDETVDLYLTGTLWEGRRTPFADDMGRRIVEVDYDATFHFSSDREVVGDDTTVDGRAPGPTVRGDLRRDVAVVEQLAVASRCTSSFPGAFEPYRVDVARDEPTGDRWQSTAGRTNFANSQFVVDGGVLRNKPIRPAIDAVYRQAAEQQVRRILAYVVPDPGEEVGQDGGGSAASLAAHDSAAPPQATDVLLGVMTRLRSTDSVSEELAEIRRRNDESRHRRRTRDRLAGVLLSAASPPDTCGTGAPRSADLAESAFPGYLEVRKESAAQTVSRFMLAGPFDTLWSQREVATVLRDLADHMGLPFIPNTSLSEALKAAPENWRWGQTTVGRLGDLVIDVLKRAVWLAPLGQQDRADIVAQRARAHEVLTRVRAGRASLNEFWRRSKRLLPARSPEVAASPEEIAALRAALEEILPKWDGVDDEAQRSSKARLRGQALDFARCLYQGADALQSVANQDRSPVDPRGVEHERLRGLVDLLLTSASSPEEVLERMLRLEVVHVAFAGVAAEAEQEVELVQVSSLHSELLTGIQLHHFGAFYRESWRANDWLRGRLDGCEQLVQMLLAPERLKQRGLGPVEAQEALRAVALGPEDGPHYREFLVEWTAAAPRIKDELAVLGTDDPLPRTFPACAERIAQRLEIGVLEQELPGLISAADGERDAVQEGKDWAAFARSTLAARPTGPTTEELSLVLMRSEAVGKQRIKDESRAGTDTFTRTATHASAALTSTTTSITKPKQLATLLRAFRGYVLLVWVLLGFLASRSNTGRNVFSVAVGVGGALLALTLLVPAVPIGVTLSGVVLLLAAISVAALRQKPLLGRSRLRGRAIGLTVVALLALAAVVVQTVITSEQSWWEVLLSLLLRVLVVALIIGVGWFLAGRQKRTGAATATPAE